MASPSPAGGSSEGTYKADSFIPHLLVRALGLDYSPTEQLLPTT